jgi:hypothetical protein
MENRRPANPEDRSRRRETLAPAFAVGAVAAVAVATAFVVKRAETSPPQQAILEPARQEQAAVRPPPSEKSEVVVAPPLKRPDTSVLGAQAACDQCGVVEMVVAVYDHGKPAPRGYQMHVRMDDGSVRTVEQRGAFAAGSRVVVEGKSLRPLAQSG